MPDASDGPGGGSVFWMLNRPETDWGRLMPNLSNQRRSENVEDTRGQPWGLPEYAYKYLGIEHTPKEVLQGMMEGLRHPLTKQFPWMEQAVPAPTQMSRELGGGDIDQMIRALRGQSHSTGTQMMGVDIPPIGLPQGPPMPAGDLPPGQPMTPGIIPSDLGTIAPPPLPRVGAHQMAKALREQ